MWQFAPGQPLQEALASLAAVVAYCTWRVHPLWDVHLNDVLLHMRGDGLAKMILLDCIQLPDENSGFAGALPLAFVQVGQVEHTGCPR